MNRTLRYKLAYIIVLCIVTGGAIIVYTVTKSLAAIAAVAVLLLLPGRIGGYYLKNLFRSRSLFDQRRFNDAIDAGRAFLAQLQRQPWRRHFIYCFFGFYTWSVEAMAHNTIGAAFLELGDLSQAEAHLQAALKQDPDNPIPIFNLGLIAYVRGDEATGSSLISAAAAKGYNHDLVDRTIARISAAYARFQA